MGLSARDVKECVFATEFESDADSPESETSSIFSNDSLETEELYEQLYTRVAYFQVGKFKIIPPVGYNNFGFRCYFTLRRFKRRVASRVHEIMVVEKQVRELEKNLPKYQRTPLKKGIIVLHWEETNNTIK